MCKSEIFAEILNLVGKETEVSTELILSSSKVTEVVDARSIVVFFLTELQIRMVFPDWKVQVLP